MPYEAGILKAVGKKNGRTVSEVVQTTSGPAAIRLSADRKEIDADAHDIVNVKVEIVDENGLVVPDANNLVEFRIEGEGVLIGTDNGNPQDKANMKSNRRNAFNGLALAVIQSNEKTGNIKITAASANLKDAVLMIVSDKPATTPDTIINLH